MQLELLFWLHTHVDFYLRVKLISFLVCTNLWRDVSINSLEYFRLTVFSKQFLYDKIKNFFYSSSIISLC